MAISVSIVSRDENLLKSCREILAELFGTEWTIVSETSGHTTTSDRCLWDFIPGETTIPKDLDRERLDEHGFLLHSKELTALHSVVGTTDLNVLLKPVTRAALRAFLGRSIPRDAERNDHSNGAAAALRVERDVMLQFLIQANLKVQENEQDRNNFLARSVHEFRAPLTAIAGFCGLLLEEEFGPLTPEQAKVLQRMLQSAIRLSRISNAMFELSVPGGVDQTLSIEKADIRDCLDHALHEVALLLEDKRISIAAEIEAAPEGLLFDKSQMEQVFVNLLDNASRFTPRDGGIEIKGYSFFWDRRTGQAVSLEQGVDRRADRVEVFNSFRVDIRDSGPGIPSMHADRIFAEFTSYGGGKDRSGGGLGLAICRMILHRHQGRIWAESDHAGTVFSFVLPLQKAIECRPAGESLSEPAFAAGPEDKLCL